MFFSDTESVCATFGVTQVAGLVRQPAKPYENQHPMHTENELDVYQSMEFPFDFNEVSVLCIYINKSHLEREASVSHSQSVYGESHGLQPAEPVQPSKCEEPTALSAPGAHQGAMIRDVLSSQAVQANGNMVTTRRPAMQQLHEVEYWSKHINACCATEMSLDRHYFRWTKVDEQI